MIPIRGKARITPARVGDALTEEDLVKHSHARNCMPAGEANKDAANRVPLQIAGEKRLPAALGRATIQTLSAPPSPSQPVLE